MIELFSFVVSSLVSSRFCKFSCTILMFHFSLNLSFNSRPCLTPLLHSQFQFLLSPFVSNQLILILKPNFFDFLLLHIICWIIMIVIWSSFKPVLSLKYNSLFIICVEPLKWQSICSSLFLFEYWLCLRSHICKNLWCYSTLRSFFIFIPHRIDTCEQPTKAFPFIIIYSILSWCHFLVNGSQCFIKPFPLYLFVLFLI